MTHVVLITAHNDDIDLVERIGDRLQKTFGRKNITFIEANTASALEHLAHHAVVLLPISSHASNGMAWLTNTDDPATQILQAAITQKFPIIPLLLKGTPMPRAEAWPESLHTIANYNAVSVRGSSDFPNDIEQLIRAVKYVEHLRDDEMVDVVPVTPTQAFIQYIRLPQSRRALTLIIGTLCLGIMSIALTSGLRLQTGSSSPSPITLIAQIAANVLPTLGVGLGLVWLLPSFQAPFGRALTRTIGLLVSLMILPVGMVILATLPAINGNGFVLDNYLSYNYEFSLIAPIVLPKLIAVISVCLLFAFIRRVREHRLTTGLAGVATIIFPLLGADWSQPSFVAFPIFGAIAVVALLTLVVATLLILWRAARLRRWWWLAGLSLLLVVSFVNIVLTQQELFLDYSVAHPASAIIQTVFTTWSVVAPVLANTVWPITVLLAPWLMSERIKR